MEKVRTAKISDAKKIHKIINYYAQRGLLLPISLSEIYERIRDFFVYEKNGEIIGCGALKIVWEDLAEVRSLAVVESYKNKGIGKKILKKCLNEAKKIGIKKVFTLTYIPDFFIKRGFTKIEKSELPNKIWSDCLKCPKFPDCFEVPLIYKI